MIIKNMLRLWLTAFITAWCFDFLFWKQEPGISFAIFVAICLLGIFYLSRKEELPPASASLILLAPVIFFSLMTFLRKEPFTLVVNILLLLALLSIFAMTFGGGKWLRYSLTDMITGVFQLAFSAIVRPISSFGERAKMNKDLEIGEDDSKVKQTRALLPVLRGIILALPVVALLAALLASADAVFSEQLQAVFSLFRIERLPEYIFRLSYIVAGGYLLVGIFLHMLICSREEKLIGQDKKWLPLGFTEAVIVLGAVNALFAFFVAVQFRYLFGGLTNISIEGFTYAEYARRGFSEMVAVAFLSLLLLFGLAAITRRDSPAQRRTFSAMGILLVALVVVILVSAFQRLLLYEAAYGFTRNRTSTHIFMLWLGILLVSTALIELVRKERLFGILALAAAIGYGVTINLINMDQFIVQQNVGRAESGSELDMAYLVSLSDDSVPAIVERFNDKSLSQAVRDDLGGALACRRAIKESEALQRADINQLPLIRFQSYHVSKARAEALLASQAQALQAYPTRMADDGWWQVKIQGEMRDCYTSWGMD